MDPLSTAGHIYNNEINIQCSQNFTFFYIIDAILDEQGIEGNS